MRLTRKIHMWMALPLGVVMAITALTGALLAFEPEITRSMQHDLYYVKEVKPTTLPEDSLRAKVASVLPADVEVKGVKRDKDPERAWQFMLSKPRKASMTVDQYTGEILGRAERPAFFLTIFRLHRWLMDPSDVHAPGLHWGRLIVGVSTGMFAVALITGAMLWWQRARRGMKRSLTVVRGKGARAFWSSLHVSIGAYICIFLLVMALTGLTWSFGWYKSLFSLLISDKGVIYGLHTGSIGGITTRIIWCVSALLGTLLPITGYYIYFKRKSHMAR